MENTLFEQLGLSNELQKAIEDAGFTEATPIQAQTMPAILAGRDVMGRSQTGSGKTAAFVLPALEMINPKQRGLQVLILCPTRELAMQCSDEIRKFTKYQEGISTLAIYGGQPIGHQIKALKKGVQIVAGTPGRIMDHLNRRTLKTGTVKMVVLDEADEMLRMGFREDIETILSTIPETRQTVLFSATMPRDILRISSQYQRDPVIVKIEGDEGTTPDIQQFYYEVPNFRKIDALENLLAFHKASRSLVFCNTKQKVDQISEILEERGFCVRAIHGDIRQESRTRIMRDFKGGRVDVLVATDVAARGIDVENVDAVYNFDLPQSEEYYTHRIGRTGRAGKQGTAHTLVSGKSQLGILKGIGRKGLKPIRSCQVPGASRKENPAVSTISPVGSESAPLRAKSAVDTRYLEQAQSLIQQGKDPVQLAASLLQELAHQKKQNNGFSSSRKRIDRKRA